MGKSKKITEKVKLFYRGPSYKPTRIASQDDMQTIIRSFKDCLPLRSKTFATNWRGEQGIRLKVHVGLSASLRALKQRKTKAIIYDETASNHLAKYFNEFARLQGLPCIQARGLLEKAGEFKLTTLLVVSIATVLSDDKESPVSCKAFDELCELLTEPTATVIEKPTEITEFMPPVLDKVHSSGKSKEKKQAKRAAAASKQTHVGKNIKRVKMSKKQRHAGKRK